ncbi:hypothetical protein PENTCL1PPCAC_29711, partial [Pristionchus entomophagus]
MANTSNFACPEGILRLGYVRTYYPAFFFDLYRFRAERSLPPFDGSLGAINRREIYSDVSTDDLDSLQWSHFRALQPIELDSNWQPIDHFIVLSPLTFTLFVVSYAIVTLLNHVSNIIGSSSFAVIRDVWNFGAVRQQLETGAMEWIAAEASEVQAPWLDAHPLHLEPDFKRKITQVCQASGSSVVSFFRSEWPEIYKIEDIMDWCSLNRVRLSPPSSYTDVVGISEVPFPYFFILHRHTPRVQFDRLNQILLRIYSADVRSGFLIRRYLTKLPRSDSPYGDLSPSSSSSSQAASFIALSLNRLILLFFFFAVAIAIAFVVFLAEVTCLSKVIAILMPHKKQK